MCSTYDVRTTVTDRSLLSSISSKDECKVSISVGLITLMFSLVNEYLIAIQKLRQSSMSSLYTRIVKVESNLIVGDVH